MHTNLPKPYRVVPLCPPSISPTGLWVVVSYSNSSISTSMIELNLNLGKKRWQQFDTPFKGMCSYPMMKDSLVLFTSQRRVKGRKSASFVLQVCAILFYWKMLLISPLNPIMWLCVLVSVENILRHIKQTATRRGYTGDPCKWQIFSPTIFIRVNSITVFCRQVFAGTLSFNIE